MPSDPPIPERRRYRRVRAPILIRPVSVLAYSIPRRVVDVGMWGLRAYADDRHEPGKRLELELALPDGSGATVLAEVVWVDAPPEGSPARFDVGLRFVDGSAADLDRIRRVLDSEWPSAGIGPARPRAGSPAAPRGTVALRAGPRVDNGACTPEGRPIETHTTFFRICESLCGLEVEVTGNRVVRIRADEQHVATRGFSCP